MPAGVEDGNKLRVKAEGDAGAKGGPVGDLYVFLSVKGDPLFKRTGKDIYSEKKVRVARDRELRDEVFGLGLYRGPRRSGAARLCVDCSEYNSRASGRRAGGGRRASRC